MNINNFSQSIKSLINLIVNDYGSQDPVIETLYGWFAIDNGTTDSSFKYNDDGMFELLRDVMNRDMFWVTDDGKVDVDNANNPEIATLIAPFVKADMALKVRDTF